jgi:tryptophan synthase alpha chain
MNRLEHHLRAVRASGRKILIPYFVAGLTEDWLECVRAAVHAGADAVEIGLPFSDPIMDGVVIQTAATASLDRGTTFASIMNNVSKLDVDVPLVAMTYFNVLHRAGIARAAGELRSAGFAGSIVPDLPLEEMTPWRDQSNEEELDLILMVAPSTPDERAIAIAKATQGFAYAAARMAVTGKASNEGGARDVVRKIQRGSDVPVCVGIGVSTPDDARDVVSFADGVIVGSALVQRLLDGEGPEGVEALVSSLRAAIN